MRVIGACVRVINLDRTLLKRRPQPIPFIFDVLRDFLDPIQSLRESDAPAHLWCFCFCYPPHQSIALSYHAKAFQRFSSAFFSTTTSATNKIRNTRFQPHIEEATCVFVGAQITRIFKTFTFQIVFMVFKKLSGSHLCLVSKNPYSTNLILSSNWIWRTRD